MTLKTQIAADAADVFCNTDDFGEACTFTYAADSSTKSVTAVIKRMDIETEYEIEGEYVRRIARAIVPKSQLTTAPSRLDTITDASGTMWLVTSIPATDEAVYVLSLKKMSRNSQGSLNDKD
jgi:hypothetical protein